MESKRFLSDDELEEYRNIFKRTLAVLIPSVKLSNLKAKISITLQDSIFFAVAKNIGVLESLAPEQVAERLNRIEQNALFSEDSLAEGLAKKERLKERMRKAEELMR